MSSFESSSVSDKVYGLASDVISNLPDCILENILKCLPLRDTVRTSVLSKRWRYSWETLGDLVFDDSLSEEELPQERILLIIYQVLDKIKTVRKFCLACRRVGSCPELDNLIIGLFRRGQIEEFILRVGRGPKKTHDLPICLSSFEKLSHLDLAHCVFSLPATFRGYSMLVSLELFKVLITEDSFLTLISSCPLLEILKFETYKGTAYGHIQIENPSLKIARFVGIFKSVSFKNASRLASVGLLSRWPAGEVEVNAENTFFSNLPILEDLGIAGHYIMSWDPSVIKFPSPRHLKILNLHMVSLDTARQNTLALWLMLSPKLEFLRIQLVPSHQKYLDKWPDVYFEQLRDVYVENALGTATEIEFFKIMLTRSRVLEKLVIKPHKQLCEKGSRILLKELSGCECLSPKAKVIITKNKKAKLTLSGIALMEVKIGS